jgi:hypothetical protein
MREEIEEQLNRLEAAIEFYRNHLMSGQSLMNVLLKLYNALEELEREKKAETTIENGRIRVKAKK